MINDSMNEYTTRVKLLTSDSLLMVQTTIYGENPQINLAIRDNVSTTSSYGTLKPGWNWLSFPRLERMGNNPVDAIGVS